LLPALTLEYDVSVSERQAEMVYLTKLPVAKITWRLW